MTATAARPVNSTPGERAGYREQPAAPVYVYRCRRCAYIWRGPAVREDKARCPECSSTMIGMQSVRDYERRDATHNNIRQDR